MTSFTEIPISDIKEFLNLNNKPCGNNPYLEAWKLIENDKSLEVPTSIFDFFLAQNLSKMDIPSYKISQVLTNDTKDLMFITSLQSLPKDRILRVLKYLNKLENDMNIFDMLPKEISQSIISNLDIKSIELICEISCNFSFFCNSNLKPILKQNLKCKTNINIDNYSIKQLLFLNKNINDNMIITPKGYYYSLLLKENKIYDGDNAIHPTYLTDIIQLSTSANHAIALTAEGEVFVFGNNDYGQLGLGHNIKSDIPQLIDNVDDVIYVSVSDRHSMLLTSTGDVYITKNNKFDKLEIKNIIQISAGLSHSLALSEDKNVYLIKSDKIDLFMKNSDVISISTGYDHSLLLNNKGLVYAYGNNDYGQLGPNDSKVETPTIITGIDNIIHIIAGDKYSLVLTDKEEVFRFGLKEDQANYSPIKVLLS